MRTSIQIAALVLSGAMFIGCDDKGNSTIPPAVNDTPNEARPAVNDNSNKARPTMNDTANKAASNVDKTVDHSNVKLKSSVQKLAGQPNGSNSPHVIAAVDKHRPQPQR